MKKQFAIVLGVLIIGMLFVTPALFLPKDQTAQQKPVVGEEEIATNTPGEKPQQSSTPTYQQEESPAPPTPSEPVPNSPKQTEIREDTPEQYVYYPMLTANDPGYSGDWALQTVNAPEAWDIATGDDSTIVAVIDTGFALGHDDLIDAWYENIGETGTTTSSDACWTGTPANKQTNNCDDDSNGYVDDWRGWNFVFGDNNPQAGRDNPNGESVGHGTETSGLVGARGNNSTGITTINWQTRIMPLQALTDDGPGYTSDVAAAIYYAVDNGADVINMSLGSASNDATVLAATDYAYDNNVMVIAASGNCGTGTEQGCSGLSAGYITYPARNPHVISVGATDINDARASFSSYGTALDVVAPGADVAYSPTWTPSDGTSLYATSLYGTSFAAPYVSSLASLIKSIRPSSSIEDITAIILGSAHRPASMGSSPYSTQLGHGVIDAEKALVVASSLNITEEIPTLLQTGNYKSEHSFSNNQSMVSGCQAQTADTYCTVWMQQLNTGYDRYLPYTQANGTSLINWSWNTSIIGNSGAWDVRAVQGETASASYVLIRK